MAKQHPHHPEGSDRDRKHDGEDRGHEFEHDKGNASHIEIEERRFRGGLPPTPELYEHAREQWNRLPGSVVRSPMDPATSNPPADSKAKPAEAEVDEDEKDGLPMSLNGTVWAPIGPSPLHAGIDVNGQVTSIAVNPNNPKVIYIGTAWGGIWRTRDGGTNWTPLFDRAPSLGIGEPAAIAIDPIDTEHHLCRYQ